HAWYSSGRESAGRGATVVRARLLRGVESRWRGKQLYAHQWKRDDQPLRGGYGSLPPPMMRRTYGFISHTRALAPRMAASDSLRWLTRILTLFWNTWMRLFSIASRVGLRMRSPA